MAWECTMENAVRRGSQTQTQQEGGGVAGVAGGHEGVRSGARLVLLELGCGLSVPSVRMEMECVLGDLSPRHPEPKPAPAAPDGASGEGGVAPSGWSQWRAGAGTGAADAGGGGGGGVAEGPGAGEVVLIRVNPAWPQNPGWESQSLSIRAGALAALGGIDAALLAMGVEAVARLRERQ